MEDGNARFLEGGVEGTKIRDDFAARLAGDGDVARYRRRSAPSSPAALPLLWRAARLREGGGVLGGEERKVEAIENECDGRSWSSSSETWPKGGEAGIVVSDLKERSSPRELEKCD